MATKSTTRSGVVKPAGTIGRPPSYKPEYAKQAKKLCELGATDQELAQFFEVSLGTLLKWKASHDPFTEALKSAREVADNRVERSLYARALGYSHPAVKFFNEKGKIVRADYIEHYAPDTAACIFWLKNRMPLVWRDKPLGQTGDEDTDKLLAAIQELLPN